MAKQPTKIVNSMPKQPALKGRRWTKTLAEKILYRWVLVGWKDVPSEPVLIIGHRGAGAGFEPFGVSGKDWKQIWIDSPEQIIGIGPHIEDFPYVYDRRAHEWLVIK